MYQGKNNGSYLAWFFSHSVQILHNVLTAKTKANESTSVNYTCRYVAYGREMERMTECVVQISFFLTK